MSDVIEDGTPIGADKAEEIKRSLTDGGFEVRVQEAGILLQATPATIRVGKKNPPMFFNQLPDVINRLTGLAEAYQCSPREA